MRFLLILLVAFSFLSGSDKTDLILQEIKGIKEDIKIMREDMDKRFEQMDKRIEMVQSSMDRRFEQVDRRMNFMENLLYALMGLIFASPFIAIHLRDKREAEERKILDGFKGILFVLREKSQEDETIAKALKAAGLA